MTITKEQLDALIEDVSEGRLLSKSPITEFEYDAIESGLRLFRSAEMTDSSGRHIYYDEKGNPVYPEEKDWSVSVNMVSPDGEKRNCGTHVQNNEESFSKIFWLSDMVIRTIKECK